jgi:predicted amidophosphoribosyltransferase
MFEWNSETAPIVRSLVYAFKGGRRIKLLSLLLERWIPELGQQISVKELHLVPVPSKDPSSLDHAAAIAETIGQIIGNEPANLLKNVMTGTPQRGKGLGDRLSAKFELNSNTPTLREKRFVLIDDVVTSGSTAMTAMAALIPESTLVESEYEFEVWALAHRPQLAAEMRV